MDVKECFVAAEETGTRLPFFLFGLNVSLLTRNCVETESNKKMREKTRSLVFFPNPPSMQEKRMYP